MFSYCSRENVDRASDEQEYEGEILAEVEELEAESEEKYQRKLAEYKKQLEEWKLRRRKQVPTYLLFISLAWSPYHASNTLHNTVQTKTITSEKNTEVKILVEN